jgi:hypothetical protein
MKNYTLKIFVFVVFTIANIFPQIEEDWPGFKVNIPFIKILETKTIYAPSRFQTHVYPPKIKYTGEIIGYDFLLEITVSIHGKKEWFSQIVPIVVKTPDNKKTMYYFNQEQILLRTNNLYTFTITVRSKYQGYTQVGFLRKYSGLPDLQEVYDNGIRLE